MPAPSASATAWWRTAVVYQVYIRSFADGDGDGVGDIAGIRSRLPYLHGLGVDALWITPWYPSPMADGGYDVADYRDVDPLFGSLADAEGLVREAHALGIRVLLDIVPNHTSVAHPWFREALAAPAGSPARNRYLFRQGLGSDGVLPPNGWVSLFGGPAWTRVDDDARPGEWYLHLFDSSQPDLNWGNPEVRAEFESILEFWISRGIDGFRIDVALFLTKDPSLPDLPATGEPPAGLHPFADRDEVHEIYRSWRRLTRRHGDTVVFCGEIDLPADRIARYLRPDELHTAFNFDLVRRPWAAGPMRRSIDRTLASHALVGAPATWVIGNHDLPRAPFRLGRDEAGEEANPWTRAVAADQAMGLGRARAAALLTLALPGVGYVYQGDELGLPEVLDLPPEVRRDPTFHRTGGAEIGRDGDRVPIPWSGTETPFGFGPAGSVPWLPQPAAWEELSVAAQDTDPASTLSMYRRALEIRRTDEGLRGDAFAWLTEPDGALHFERGSGFRCLVNVSGRPIALPAASTLLVRSDAPTAAGDPLPPGAAAWYRPSRQAAIDVSAGNSDNSTRD
jgi:alpha-glucosidase